MSYIDRTKILVDMAEGLLRRTYLIINIIQAAHNEKPAFLIDPELTKIRSKIDKSFPELPDLSKGGGNEILTQRAPAILEGLSDFEDVMIGIVDFSRVAEPLLQDIPRELLEVKIEKAQPIIMAYFDLMLSYMRVFLLLSTFVERKTTFALYSAAYATLNQGKKCPSWNDACILLALSENLQRFFIDSFASIAPLLKPLLLQLRESIVFSTSIQACDQLRSQYILNPANEGDRMPLPSKLSLSPRSSLSAYSEIINAEKYSNYVIFVHLACPSLFFSPDSLDLFESVASGLLFVPIFRDLSLSIHEEIDLITQHFPGKDDAVSVPKGFKFKTSMRAIAKKATKESGHRMRYRRSYITAELQNIKGILLTNPALFGPKFPLVLAACAFAKAEVLAYFRHIDQQGGVRKDCRKHYMVEEFNNTDITSLKFELGCIADLIRKYSPIVMEYYAEYLKVNDVKVLSPLVADCSASIAAFQPILGDIVRSLSKVDINQCESANPNEMFLSTAEYIQRITSGTANLSIRSFSSASVDGATEDGNAEDKDKPASPHPSRPSSQVDNPNNMESVRVNWSRFLAMYLSGKYGSGNSVTFDSLINRLRAAIERTTFLDSIPQLMKDLIEPYEIWWFRIPFYNAFVASVHFTGNYLYPYQSVSYFRPLTFMHYNFHDDAGLERYLLKGISVRLADTMIEVLSNQIIKQVQSLWDYMLKLESQILPIEAGSRVERLQAARKKDLNALPESLPGFESEGGESRKIIAKFVAIRANLVQLLGAAQQFGNFSVYHHEYNVSVLLRNTISSYLDQKMQGLFMNTLGKDEVTCRPSLAVTKFVTLCRAIQTSLAFLGSNFQVALRGLLFEECVDLSMPPPGSAIPIGIAEPTGSLVWRLANWFSNVSNHISTPGSGVVWSDNRKMFVYLPNAYSSTSASSSGAMSGISISANALTNFLTADDMKQLCSVIGPQGVRVIESVLIDNIVDKIRSLVRFIDDNRNSLIDFEKAYCLNIRSAFRVKGIHEFEGTLSSIGVSLCLREMLHNALGESIAHMAPNLPKMLESVAKTLLPWAEPLLCTPVYTMLSDVGPIAQPDLSLASCLSQSQLTYSREAYNAGNASNNTSDLLHLFPVACACIFASERWESAAYNYNLEAFERNEHASMIAAASLMTAFYVLDTNSSTENIQSATPASSSTARIMSDKFLKIAAQLLLTLRSAESTTYSSRPLRPMCILLETFVSHSSPGVVTRYDLEKYFPYSLLHSCVMDVSLGKHKESDMLKQFTYADAHGSHVSFAVKEAQSKGDLNATVESAV